MWQHVCGLAYVCVDRDAFDAHACIICYKRWDNKPHQVEDDNLRNTFSKVKLFTYLWSY